eukprot:665333-Prymnesium_polylepis.1
MWGACPRGAYQRAEVDISLMRPESAPALMRTSIERVAPLAAQDMSAVTPLESAAAARAKRGRGRREVSQRCNSVEGGEWRGGQGTRASAAQWPGRNATSPQAIECTPRGRSHQQQRRGRPSSARPVAAAICAGRRTFGVGAVLKQRAQALILLQLRREGERAVLEPPVTPVANPKETTRLRRPIRAQGDPSELRAAGLTRAAGRTATCRRAR